MAFDAEAFSVYAVVVTERYISADGQTWNIRVSYDAEAGIPDGATLEVRELEDAEYQDCYARAADALEGRAIAAARFFDIGIVCDGVRIQPESAVSVKIDMAPSEGDVQALHFDGDAIQRIDAAVEGEAVRFDAGGFSVYGVVYTVDFYFGGYEYHLTGEGEMLLSALLRALEIDIDMADVADVTFSDPALVEIVPGDGDWRLISRVSFDTEETLTLTLKNGGAIVIAVTDALHVPDLTHVLTDAALYENGEPVAWPVSVRENRYYDLRLSFAENKYYQFLDTDQWMTYPLPEGIDLGSADFERTFDMDVGDGVTLKGNTLRYDATLRMFFFK